LRPSDFPVSLAAYESAISLPIYPAMTEDQIDRVVDAVRTVGDSAAE
jgi:dTDP-4-amino-4,6-dideoxygalactose transaminase